MSNLNTEVEKLKSSYRAIFLKTNDELFAKLQEIAPEKQVDFLTETVLKQSLQDWLKIFEYRKLFSCTNCGACCKLACSEFSPEELNAKASSGDNFAQQFLSVFEPYKNESEAEKIYPEYFELLKNEIKNEESNPQVHFYHCPKVTKDNKCPDYENRPQICRDFPDNPLGFLPKTCGFKRWKEEVEETALKVRATMEIVEFYKNKLSS